MLQTGSFSRKMSLAYVRSVLCVLVLLALDCNGQFFKFRGRNQINPVPFPTCRADSIDCLRRGLRTFFVLMDTGHVGMKTIDPFEVNSVAVTFPGDQLSVLLRRANVTGARWTKLNDRRFNFDGGNSSTTLSSDLHVTGDIVLKLAFRVEPYVAHITMDIHEVESKITYPWSGVKGIDSEGYILIGPERIAVRNSRTPSYFLQTSGYSGLGVCGYTRRYFQVAGTLKQATKHLNLGLEQYAEDAVMIDNILQEKQSILDHLSNEITTTLMHTIVDNVRLFTSSVPVRYYYNYN